MSKKQDRGGHSRDPQEEEKPLKKKARYVWEVKGKKHLKGAHLNNNNNDEEIIIEEDPKGADNNNETTVKHESGCSANGLSVCYCIKPYLMRIDKMMEDADVQTSRADYRRRGTTTTTQSDRSADVGEPSSSSSVLPPPPSSPPVHGHGDDEAPPPGGDPPPLDYYLHRWQARQMARGFVDNTINSVLESWGVGEAAATDRDDDVRIEDDAILMAIRSHGLQSSSGGEDGEVVGENLERFSRDNVENYRKERGGGGGEMGEARIAEDHMDFLDAAVSAAIKKKGLSYGF